jgi:hypothetical protein
MKRQPFALPYAGIHKEADLSGNYASAAPVEPAVGDYIADALGGLGIPREQALKLGSAFGLFPEGFRESGRALAAPFVEPTAGNIAGAGVEAALMGLPAAKAMKLTARPMSNSALHEIGASNFTTPYAIDKLTEVPLSSLTGAKHWQDKVAPLADEIKQSGWLEPLVVDKAGNIIEGQHRLRALQQLGVDQVPVHRLRELMESDKFYAVKDAAKSAGVHGDQASQIALEIAEIIDEEGVGALGEYEAPRGFEKAWAAAVEAASRD